MTRCGGVFSASWMRASTSRRRSSAAASRSSERARHLARLGKRLDGGDGGLVVLGLLVFGLLQPVGGGLAQDFGLAKLRHQAAAPRLDLVGRVFEPGPLGCRPRCAAR